MFRTILVPLDGTPAGESALPLAVSVARRAEASLRLIHVRSGPPPHAGAPPREQDYLDMVAFRIRQATHVPVYAAVLDGPVGETIAEHSRAVHADLIVATTHGRGPFSRMWLGSVADELIRNAPAPVLVIRPKSDTAPPPPETEWAPRHILVPLDGSALAEAALAPASQIARLMHADLTLLRVVEPIPVLAPEGLMPQPLALDASALDELKTQARTYVDRAAERLRKDGVAATGRITIDDRAISAILDEEKDFDLTAIATHARHGLARALLGSVADKLVRGANGPVLVARPPAQ